MEAEVARIRKEDPRSEGVSVSSITEAILNLPIVSSIRGFREIDDPSGTPRASLDLSVAGRPVIVFYGQSRPGPSLRIEATAEGTLLFVEDREPNPLFFEVAVNPDGTLRLVGRGSADAPARE